MKVEFIDRPLKTIVTEDLLQVILKLQVLITHIDKYMEGLTPIRSVMEDERWSRANDVTGHINLAILDLADLLSMELADKILED